MQLSKFDFHTTLAVSAVASIAFDPSSSARLNSLVNSTEPTSYLTYCFQQLIF